MIPGKKHLKTKVFGLMVLEDVVHHSGKGIVVMAVRTCSQVQLAMSLLTKKQHRMEYLHSHYAFAEVITHLR